MSFGISYGSSWCVRVTSSTTYSMVGALNKLPISIFGMLIFDDAVGAGQIAGVLLGMFMAMFIL
jgi:GDP-mannose transporter